MFCPMLKAGGFDSNQRKFSYCILPTKQGILLLNLGAQIVKSSCDDHRRQNHCSPQFLLGQLIMDYTIAAVTRGSWCYGLKTYEWPRPTTVTATNSDGMHKPFQLQNRAFQGGPGSVRFGYGLGIERFERFRFSVPAVPLRRGVLCVFQYSLTERTVPVPRSVPGKTVPAVPVSGSGSVPGPPWPF